MGNEMAAARRLTLTRETVRELVEADLGHAAGGQSGPCQTLFTNQCPVATLYPTICLASAALRCR